MIRAVLDANVIVSGMVAFPDPSRVLAVVLRTWVRGRFELLISDHILDEVIRTAAKPYFSERIDHRLRERLINAVSQQATRVQITHAVSGVATHPEDDLVLATAMSAEADYLVTGDRQLRRLDRFGDVAIVSPAMFRAVVDDAHGK